MIDFTKPVTTRDGQEVTIYTTNHIGNEPVVGRIGDSRHTNSWRLDGAYAMGSHPWDLVQAPLEFSPKPSGEITPTGVISNTTESEDNLREFYPTLTR